MFSTSLTRGLRQCFMQVCIKASGRSWKVYTGSGGDHGRRMRNLCQKAKGFALEPRNSAHSEDQSFPRATSPADCFYDDENSRVHVKKTTSSKLLQAIQQHATFPSSSVLCHCQQSSGRSYMPRTMLTQFSCAFPLKLTIN